MPKQRVPDLEDNVPNVVMYGDEVWKSLLVSDWQSSSQHVDKLFSANGLAYFFRVSAAITDGTTTKADLPFHCLISYFRD